MLPQITFKANSGLWKKKLPILSSIILIHKRTRHGRRSYSQGLRSTELKAQAQKTFKRGKFTLTPNQTYTQRLFSTKDANYVMNHTTNATYDFKKNPVNKTQLALTYRKMADAGGKPFSPVSHREQVSLGGNFTIMKSSIDPFTRTTKANTSFRVSTNYNYKRLTYSPLSITYTRNMTQNSRFELTGNRDLNLHRWSDATTKFRIMRKNTEILFTPIWATRDFDLKSMNFQTKHIRRNGWKVDVRGAYQHRNSEGLIREIIATKSRCCTEMQFQYIVSKKEFKFQYSILAFPSKKFGFTQGEQGFEMDDSFTEFKSEAQGQE
ncbi:hypothetical protein ACFLQK_00680, partial [bacterium]